jgi:hypothetical protein
MCFLAKRDTIYVINPTLPDCLFLVDLSFLYQAQLIFFFNFFFLKERANSFFRLSHWVQWETR